MSQKLPVKNFKWVKDISKFDESFKKNYNEERDKGYFLEADVQYSENLHNLHHDLPEGIKIESVKQLVASLHDKTEYFIHIRNLKQALNHGVVMRKLHRIIKFNEKS